MPAMRQVVILLMVIVSVTCGLSARASADIQIQTLSGLQDNTGFVTDHRGNVYALSEWVGLVRIAPDGTTTDLPFTPPVVRSPGYAHGLVWGPDNALWFTCNDVICHVDANGGGLIDTPGSYPSHGTPTASASWDVDRVNGTITQTTPGGSKTFAGLPSGATGGAGPITDDDGGAWLTYGDFLVHVTPAGTFAVFPLPPGLPVGEKLRRGPDGNLWLFTVEGLVRLSETAALLGRSQLPAVPDELVAGPDGNVWYLMTSPYFGGFGRISPSGRVSEFGGAIGLDLIENMLVAADGAIWFHADRMGTVWRVVPDPPTVSTDPATQVVTDAATLNASVDPKGGPTSASFEYGTTLAYGSETPKADLGDGEGPAAATAVVHGLQPGATYHYRAVAVNGMRTIYGPDRTLTTVAGPGLSPPPPPPDSEEDADHDGYPSGVDCNDHNKAIHPGATDRPGDKVDQDCSGTAARYGYLAPPIGARWVTRGPVTRFTRMIIGALPARTLISLSCAGRGCHLKPYRSRTAAATKRTNLLRYLKASELRRGAVVELRLSRAGQATRIIRWRIGPPARRAITCRAPGARGEAPCW